jgi:hypothetical protein
MTLIRLLSDPCHDTFVTAAGDGTLDIKPADKRSAEDDLEIALLPRPPGLGIAAIHSFEYCSPMHSYP